MARCCGGSGTCACKIEAGPRIEVTGTGTSQDPFVIVGDVELGVEDSSVFDLGLSGEGTSASPWLLRVGYASTSHLKDIPDVSNTAPANGQVLAWNTSQQAWVPSPAATATAGTINHDSSVNGDGSTGAPLGVKPDTTRYLSVTATGVGLNNAGINALVRVFPDAATRAVASPAPTTNAVSLLASNPGQIDYWDGAAWQPVTNGIGLDVQTGQMLSLSGSYAGGPVTQYVAQVSATTDGTGLFTPIPAADLASYAGVLSVSISEMGTTPWKAIVAPATDRITAKAYRLTDGSVLAGAPVTAVVTALLY